MSRSMNLVLPLLLVSACASERPGAEEHSTTSTRALGSFVFNSAAIETPPDASLPATRLVPKAYDIAVLGPGLVRTGESFTQTTQVAGRKIFDSASWAVEADARGSALAVSKLPPGPAVAVDEQLLRAQSIDRLASWGLPRTEMGSVVQRKLMLQDDDSAAGSGSALHRYKTFVLRGFNGVPVIGHRAVISHGRDGQFARAYVTWPALAASGHRLRTALTTAQIEAAAAAALIKEGETGGNVALRWKYVATPSTDGANGVTLTLMVGAYPQPARARDGTLLEQRDIDVDVKAL